MLNWRWCIWSKVSSADIHDDQNHKLLLARATQRKPVHSMTNEFSDFQAIFDHEKMPKHRNKNAYLYRSATHMIFAHIPVKVTWSRIFFQLVLGKSDSVCPQQQFLQSFLKPLYLRPEPPKLVQPDVHWVRRGQRLQIDANAWCGAEMSLSLKSVQGEWERESVTPVGLNCSFTSAPAGRLT